MKVKEIICAAAGLLGKANVAAYLSADNASAGTGVVAEVNSAVRLLNVLLCEIAGSYLPMIKKETPTVKNGKIYYEDLTEDVIRIREVLDANGEPEFFVIHTEYVTPRSEPSAVVYEYIPAAYGLTDEIGAFEKPVTVSVLAYGLAAEICLSEGRYKESVVWRERFSDGLSAVVLPKCGRAKSRCFI